jgi:iron(III) transport system permease protein
MGAAGWSILASPGRTGFLNQFVGSFIGSYPFNIHGPRGIIWVLGLYFAPAAYLLIASSLESMDPSLEESGQVHGAGVFRTARLISLPLVMPAITSSFILIFVLSIGQFGVPAVLGVPYGFPVITTRIYEYVVGLQPNYVAAAALGVALLIIAVAFTWMQNRLLSRRSYVTVSGKGLKHREIGLGLWHIPALILMWAYVTLAVVLPFAALIWASLLRFMTSNLATARYTFGNFTYVLGEYALTQRAIVNTFLVTIPAATVVVLLGAILGWTRLRSRLSGAWIAEYIASLPLAIPSIVFSIGLLWAWIFFPVLPIYGTLWLLVICYVTIFIPLGYRAATSGLMQIDRSLEECALVHGVPQGKTFCSITLPLLRPALWAGWCLVFISTLKELSASALLTNSKTIVMSVAVFELWTGGSFPRVAAFSLIEAALIFVVLLLAGGFGRSLQKA